MARVTEAPLTVLPLASVAVTAGCVVKLVNSLTGPVGWVEKVSVETPAAVTVTVPVELAEISPPPDALRVYVPAPAVPVTSQPENVATPLAAAAGLVQAPMEPCVLPPLPAV